MSTTSSRRRAGPGGSRSCEAPRELRNDLHELSSPMRSWPAVMCEPVAKDHHPDRNWTDRDAL